jgi:hypothetical protein
MNAFIRGIIFLSVFGASVASAVEATVTVAGSKELRLAVVDSSKSTAARDQAHAAFAECLGREVSRQSGSEIGVKVKCVNADHAAFNLGTGVYDAVLVLSGTLPRALMISDVSRLSATLGSDKSEKKVYLIFSNGDELLAKLFYSSFPTALTDNRFLDAVDGVTSRIAVAAGEGSKVAAATP